MKKFKKSPIKASTKPAPKRAIKASEDSDDIVMYLEGKKVYEGDIRDIDSAIAELCKDEDNNQIFMEYLNQFGDPFDFDGTPEDTARTFAWWVAQDFDEVTFAGEDFYVQDSINGKSFEIFRKSDEAVEGSVQRRAKKSVKASNKPAPRRRAVKASNEVYRNTDVNAFPVFLGNVEDALEVATEGADGWYDIQGTRFVSDDVVDYELIVRDLSDRPKEIGYIQIEQSADGFRAWRGDDEETEFISGGSFDDILDACVENCAILIEDYENGIQDSPLA